MVASRNLVSIRLLRSIGIETAVDYITRFGFSRDELPPNLSMALGTASLTPLSMARGYAVFANGGYLVEPRYIDSVRNAAGDVVYAVPQTLICDACRDGQAPVIEQVEEEPTAPRFKPLEISADQDRVEVVAEAYRPDTPTGSSEPIYAERAISPQNAYLVRSMMMDVVRRGTGARAMQLGRQDLAGKTGTTNEQRDAWFSGYNDALVTSVWVGFDNHEPLGRRELGGRAALPVWMAFMGPALEGVEDKPPVVPEGLARGRINPETGLLAGLENPDAIMEIFEAGTLPPMEERGQGESQHAEPEENPYEIY
jgi:penicillin-binding protein 1A